MANNIEETKRPKTPLVSKDDIKNVMVGPDQKIYLVGDDNVRQRREGTKAAKIFAVYRDGMTVAEFLVKAKAIGGTLRNVRKDTAYGRIRLEGSVENKQAAQCLGLKGSTPRIGVYFNTNSCNLQVGEKPTPFKGMS